MLFSKGKSEDVIKAFADIMPDLEKYFTDRLKDGGKWLAGTENPSMIDIDVLPIVERMVLFEDSPYDDIFKKLDFKVKAPTVYGYVHRFRDIPQFKEHGILKKSAYVKYLAAMVALPGDERPTYLASYLE